MPKSKILIVDDNLDHLFVMQTALEEAGYIALTAEGPSEAREILASERPNLIITDILMPEESGYSLIASLREDVLNKDIPIIATSSLDAANESLQEGADVFLPKPFENEDLVGLVNELIKEETLHQRLQLAMALLKEKKVDEAQTLFESILKGGTEENLLVYAAFYLGEISRLTNQLEDAEAYYRKALDMKAKFWPALTQLGKFAFNRKDHKGAVDYWSRSLKIKPEQPKIAQIMESLKKL